MSRWAEDPERAADALIARSLEELGLRGRLLLVSPGPALPGRIGALGLEFTVWNRRLAEWSDEAAAWPAAGPHDVALVRLLMEKGADRRLRSGGGQTALEIATLKAHDEVARLLRA